MLNQLPPYFLMETTVNDKPVKRFPGMRWHPETGESQIFQTQEDMPAGWLDYNPTGADGLEKPKASNPLPMTREEIVAALNQGQITFKKNAGTAALYDQLRDALRKFLTERSITFEQDADGKTLLDLVSKAAVPQE